MPLALRQLGALYLTAAAAYTVAIVLSHHPAFAERAGDASVYVRSQGAEMTTAVESYVLDQSWTFARNEAQEVTRKVMVALESHAMPAEKPRVAEVPRVLHRLAANLPVPAHLPLPADLQVKPKAEAFPPPGDAQFVPAPPANTPPPRTNDVGLRTGEDEGAPNSPASNVVSRTPAAAPTQTQSLVSRVAQARPARSHLELAPQAADASAPSDATPGTATSVPNLPPPPTTAEFALVQQRLKDSLTSELYDNFELFLYVSKAASGPLAQRMYVFEKEPRGDLALAYDWQVSTGREKVEFNAKGRNLPSFTPQGYYELDPHRLFPHYWSIQWGEEMPYAMFFNWKKDGQQTGLAIHGASGDSVNLLGTRASAGCIRLPPEAAKTLFNLIRTKYRGLAPQFAVDRNTGTMSNEGILLHDADGHVQLAEGYKVLIFIEDYGGENVVAAMY